MKVMCSLVCKFSCASYAFLQKVELFGGILKVNVREDTPRDAKSL